MSDGPRTCFISAPLGANLAVLRSVLDERRVKVIVPEQLSPGSDWSADITTLLSDADLVIGVLTRARSSDSVLFELGQAWALGRKVVLFIPPDDKTVLDLRQLLVIRASLSNREAISFALDQIFRAPQRQTKPVSRPALNVSSLGGKASGILREVQAATTARQGKRLEEIVANAIRESGVDVISEARTIRQTADFAIWSDALQPFVGNPLLIEVKLRVTGVDDVRKGSQSLSEAILSSGGTWGLLLFGEGPTKASEWRSVPPNILVMSVPELIMEMESRPFVEVIRERRNRRVHGEVG